MNNSFSNSFQALEDNDREYDELLGTSTDDSSCSDYVSDSSENLCLNDEKGLDQDIQNVNPPANKVGSSSSGSMAISSSEKGSSENVKASDNTSNEDSSRSSANLCLNDEKGTDQDIQNVNPPAAKLGTSSSESMAISSSDEGSSEKVKASDNASNVKNHTSDIKEDDNNDRSSAPNFNNGGSRSFIWPSMGEEGFQNLMHIVDKLESVSRIRTVNAIFEEALDCCCIFDMMTSAYGHQVFGKLVGLLDEHNNGKLLEQITKNQLLISVSLYEYGSISVQKLIEVIHNHNKTRSIQTLTEALAEGTRTLLTHEIGKHVVLKCFGILDFDDYKTLYEALRQQCVKIARHEVGWISLCQCMDHMKNKQRILFIDGVVLKNTVPISWTSYGIQVLEYIIGLEDPNLSEKFCSIFIQFERLSFTREGARLVQICLLQSKAMMRLVVQNILKGEGLAKLACDKYGNHVIQTALKTTMENELELYWLLIETLEPCMQILRYHPTGRVVYSSIQSENFFDKDERMR